MRNERLTQLLEFKIALGLPIIISSVTFVIVLTSVPSIPDSTLTGLKYFWEIFHIPLAIASSALPLAGLVALNHRSEQTARQIELAQEQNTFTNYYKHREEFVKFINSDFKDEQVDAFLAHSVLFPNAKKIGIKPPFPLELGIYGLLRKIIGSLYNCTSAKLVNNEKEIVLNQALQNLVSTINVSSVSPFTLSLNGEYRNSEADVTDLCFTIIDKITDQLLLLQKLTIFEDQSSYKEYESLISALVSYLNEIGMMGAESGGEPYLSPYTPLQLLNLLMDKLEQLDELANSID